MARTSKKSPRTRSRTEAHAPYHHGDLRRALLDAATSAIEEEGVEGVTLRGIAARAGVSHAAPYRHFADKDALIGSVAEAGFDELREDLARAAGRCKGGIDGLVEAAVAYVDYARRRPGRYAVMFRSPRTQATKAVTASNRAFGELVALVKAAQDEGALPASDAQDEARAAWALVHGLAELASTNRLQLRGRRELARITRRSARALIRGLGAGEPEA